SEDEWIIENKGAYFHGIMSSFGDPLTGADILPGTVVVYGCLSVSLYYNGLRAFLAQETV
ncbi:MAG: hypothetical protein D3903_10045, partial [Candidatus Electrothrix sp. GM3_4]|nr:hypothetical protein [Candidatus Electrothrix sp. GM3_4]